MIMGRLFRLCFSFVLLSSFRTCCCAIESGVVVVGAIVPLLFVATAIPAVLPGCRQTGESTMLHPYLAWNDSSSAVLQVNCCGDYLALVASRKFFLTLLAIRFEDSSKSGAPPRTHENASSNSS